MKIGIDISQTVHPGGVAIYTKNLVKNLLEIDKINDYVLFGSSLRKLDLLRQTFKGQYISKFYPFPPTFLEFMFNKLRIPKIELFTGHLDVFHTSDWMEPRANCPKITTVHDLAPIIYPQMHSPKIVEVFLRKLELVKRESSMIIAVSNSTKKDLIKYFNIRDSKIRVIYEAIDDDFQKTKPDLTILEKYKLKKFIISDGFKNERKNLKNLLKALEILKDEDLQIVLPGKPLWGNKEIMELINGYFKKNNIIMPGILPPSQLKALYGKAVCAVFPSFYEGFGLSLLEAMSCGCPVIASNVSSLPEVAGKAAILVDPNSIEDIYKAIKSVTDNILIYDRFKKEGLKQVKKFSWEKAAKETLEVYKEAINL